MDSYNLLTETWIPVMGRDGAVRYIAPWELTTQPVPLALHAPRPDLNGAMMEFLIGLVQTVFPPRSRKEWRQRLKHPPSPEELRAALSPWVPCFNLFGERPCFMQDLTLEPAPGNANDIAALFITSPGENTVKKNTDFFIKRGEIRVLCPSCAAMALFAMNAFAPSGGAGVRTSLRGGGPLVTLVWGETLWERVWNNVRVVAPEEAPLPEAMDGRVFPWLEPTRVSDKKSMPFLPDSVDTHVYPFWAMPRRYLLHPEEEECVCDVCGRFSSVAVRTVHALPRGNNYEGPWRHPLTPYRELGQDKPTISVKGSADGMGYRYWLGLLYGDEGGGVVPAMCVQQYREMTGDDAADVSLHAFGYDMDNMKARQWCEGIMPFFSLPEDAVSVLRGEVARMVTAAEGVRLSLFLALKNAVLSEDQKKRASASTWLENVSAAFWQRTEEDFYRQVRELAGRLRAGESAADSQRERFLGWACCLCRTAESLYDENTDMGVFSANALCGGHRDDRDRRHNIYTELTVLRRAVRAACKKELGDIWRNDG